MDNYKVEAVNFVDWSHERLMWGYCQHVEVLWCRLDWPLLLKFQKQNSWDFSNSMILFTWISLSDHEVIKCMWRQKKILILKLKRFFFFNLNLYVAYIGVIFYIDPEKLGRSKEKLCSPTVKIICELNIFLFSEASYCHPYRFMAEMGLWISLTQSYLPMAWVPVWLGHCLRKHLNTWGQSLTLTRLCHTLVAQHPPPGL